jgi:hypothetical protein
MIAGIRWLWHLGVRKFTDKVRRDGKIAGPAPVQFFIFNTSGIVCWLGSMILIFAITK